MKDIENENARLKRLVADLSLEKHVLKDIASDLEGAQRNFSALNGVGMPWIVCRTANSSNARPAVSSTNRAVRNAIALSRGADEDGVTQSIDSLASQYGRYSDRRTTSLLQVEGWSVGVNRVQCIWRREGLKVPKKQNQGAGSGLTMVHAFNFGQSVVIKFGLTTSSMLKPMMGEVFVFCRSFISTLQNAWPFVLREAPTGLA